jgi:hypothetical protein
MIVVWRSIESAVAGRGIFCGAPMLRTKMHAIFEFLRRNV